MFDVKERLKRRMCGIMFYGCLDQDNDDWNLVGV